VADGPLYLFDGYNLLHEAGLENPRDLVDRLAGFLALRGARGVLVFDGAGDPSLVGSLEVRFAEHADDVLERLAAENRGREDVIVVSSDRAVLGTAGQESRRVPSKSFLRELAAEQPPERRSARGRTRVADALDPVVRDRLEKLRRQKH
jgi:predicted RNA-binding protein with PIN domain